MRGLAYNQSILTDQGQG